MQKMDSPCVELCKAINKLQGLHTTNSCCGHGKESYNISIIAEHINDLYPLAKCVDFTVVKVYGWTLTGIEMPYLPKSFEMLDFSRKHNLKVGFLLDSGANMGLKAYAQARRIALFILNTYNSIEKGR